MAWELKEGQGSLFQNDKKGNEKRPDWRGDCMVGGVVYEISAWTKNGRNGEFLSLAVKPKQAKAAEAPAGSVADMQDDIPF